MKKRTIALIIAVTVVATGAAGFGGVYLGNEFAGMLASYYQNQLPAEDNYQQGADAGVVAAAPADDPGSEPEEQAATDIPSDEIAKLYIVNEPGKAVELTIPEIAAQNASSVVEIYTESVVNGGRMGQYISEGAGSGVIITDSGFIITNNHVIEGASKITVRLNNGDVYDAELVGRDSKTDLAVVKITAEGLNPAIFGNSDDLVAGELAVAIGNPLGRLGGTVSEGIISALSRNIEIDGNVMTLLQTTAAVNPGNSGGGLFNRFGELIGVVNAKSSGTDIEGIGFAIPSNLAKTITEALMKFGYVPGRIDFGAVLVDVPDQMTARMYRVSETGVYVSRTDEGSKLQQGDRIVSFGGVDVSSIAEINDLLESYKAGDTVIINVSRSGSIVTVEHFLKQARS